MCNKDCKNRNSASEIVYITAGNISYLMRRFATLINMIRIESNTNKYDWD
jgi:hypothetical protein